jgi:asparagine synthase (glutamine-hydrolysing)
LHWSRLGDWLYFGSEVKALLASGTVVPAADLRGLDHLFSFFAMPNRRTMFEGVQSIPPGHYLKLAFRDDGGATEIVERRYWEFDFPDAGDEDNPTDGNALIDEFEATFRRAVEIRLRADVPVVGYLSGGVDSSYVLATASSLRGKPLPSFTIGIPGPKYNETAQANVAAQHIGSRSVVVNCDGSAIGKSYADLVMGNR